MFCSAVDSNSTFATDGSGNDVEIEVCGVLLGRQGETQESKVPGGYWVPTETKAQVRRNRKKFTGMSKDGSRAQV